ncbi:cell wall hydrolase [Pelagibacterium montanilacus]|uniref:cell wall hydrolase n=1 Tax=Pelagibacterium montanilacus TaxID=2185280 RepID=UPI003CCC8039
MSAFVYCAFAPGTGGARVFDPATELPPAPTASLTFGDGQPAIEGSVASLFSTSMFSGPNRSEKTDRLLPRTDLVAFTQGFDAVRLSIASARAAGTTYGQSGIAVADIDEAEEIGPRISVASIDHSGVEALGAIDALAGTGSLDPSVPRPIPVPERLAYSRANTPATDFTPKHAWSEREQWCLSTGIYFEARGESYRGQVAVAQVIMNRVEHKNYPNSICGVVYQNQHRRNACQFSFACDGKTNVNRTPEIAAWAQAQEITATVLDEDIYLPEVGDATHYHATYVRPRWARNMDRVTQVGLHVFYRFRPGWRFG